MVAYEIPLTLTLVSAALAAGSLRISEIVRYQAAHAPLLLSVPGVLAFPVYLLAAQAELERQPFDIPEAEQELAGGWCVEYSGWRLAMIRLAHDVETFFLSGLAAALFLGGPTLPGVGYPGPLAGCACFLLKSLAVLVVLSVLRGAMARLRVDQMLTTFWKYLMVVAMIAVALTLVV